MAMIANTRGDRLEGPSQTDDLIEQFVEAVREPPLQENLTVPETWDGLGNTRTSAAVSGKTCHVLAEVIQRLCHACF